MLDLNTVANTLKVHPRTVLRAISGQENPYWTKDHNPKVSLKEVSEGFGCSINQFKKLLGGEDLLLTPDEACELLKISKRTLRYRRAQGELTPVVARGSVVYYSRQHLLVKELKKPTA